MSNASLGTAPRRGSPTSVRKGHTFPCQLPAESVASASTSFQTNTTPWAMTYSRRHRTLSRESIEHGITQWAHGALRPAAAALPAILQPGQYDPLQRVHLV